MRIDFKIALYGLLAGIGSTVAAMALPLRYPNISPLVLDIVLFGGLALALGSCLLIIYELVFRPRLAKEVKLIPLTMIIGGILLITGGIIYHLHDKKPIQSILNINVHGIKEDHPPDTVIAGIKWNNFYSDVRVYLSNPTDRDYHDVDILLSTDLTIQTVGQITNIQNVSIMPFNPEFLGNIMNLT